MTPLMKKGLRHRLLVVQDLALSFESSPDEEGVETPETFPRCQAVLFFESSPDEEGVETSSS